MTKKGEIDSNADIHSHLFVLAVAVVANNSKINLIVTLFYC